MHRLIDWFEDLLTTVVLGPLFVASMAVVGETWAWRIVRLAHTLPYLALAYGFGWVSGWFWAAPGLTPSVSAWLTAGLVAFLMGCSWFNEWRRGY